MNIELVEIADAERSDFEAMAQSHYRELNPTFVAHDDWLKFYFLTLQTDDNLFARWIVADGERAGFAVFGVEKHRFLPRLTGLILELYVAPAFRRRRVGTAAGQLIIEQLRSGEVSKIQLEVMEGNERAALLWQQMGFAPVSTRFVLNPNYSHSEETQQ